MGFMPGFYGGGGGYGPPPPHMGGGVGFGAFPMAFGGGFPVATPGYSYPPAGVPADGGGGHVPPVAKLASDAPFADEFSKGGGGGGGYAPPAAPAAAQVQQVGNTGVGVGFTAAGDLVVTGPPGTTVKVVQQPLQQPQQAPPAPPPPAALSADLSCTLSESGMPVPPGGDAAASAASPPSFEDLEARFAALQRMKQ